MPTIDSIRPLITDLQQTPRAVELRLRCPRTGREIEASAPLRKRSGIKAEAGRTLKKEVFRSAKKSLMGALRGALGSSSIAGKVAGNALQSGSRDAEARMQFSADEVDDAIVAAFESVQDQFQWDEKDECWTAAEQAAEPA